MRTLTASVLFLTLSAAASAQVDADLAATYVEHSGLPSSVEQVAAQLRQQLGMQVAGLPAPAQDHYRTLIQEELSEEGLRARLRAHVATEGEPDSVRAAVAWLEQPLVQRMEALSDSAVADGDAQVALQMYAMTGRFTSFEVTPERDALVERLLAATGGADAFVDLYLDLTVASAEATSSLPGRQAPPADSIRAQMRPQLEAAVGGAAKGGVLYAYRTLPDDEVEAYVALLAEPAGRYSTRLSREAMNAALVGAIRAIAGGVVQKLQELDAAGEIDLDATGQQGGGQ